ncbi:MAG TPA: TolC family protein [Terriglobales bacterium]|nr:TolC family protein [Terriglobales bacterium]
MHSVRGLLTSVLIFLMIMGQGPALMAQDANAGAAGSQPQAAQQPQAQQPGAQPQQPAAQNQSGPPSAPQPQITASKPMRLVDYSKPRSHIFNPIAPYLPTQVPEPSLQNSPRIEQIVQNGTIMLSLDDAVALALENNLDIAIARYNLSIADTDILRAKSGQATRGVATGIVQGTQGGGVGGFGTGASGAGPGGTAVGTGGAGAGTGGIVTSTSGVGPAVESFDPFVSGNLQLEHAVFPQTSLFLTGVPTLNQNTATANFNYTQGWATGTAMTLTFDNQRNASNNLRSSLQPSITSSFRLNMRQHLLQGIGINSQTRFIRIAKNDKRISISAFRQQVETTVAQIQNIYWDLVNAYEDLKVKERSLALANKTLADNRKQVEIGTLAPIEIVRAQSDAAARQQDLIVSQTALELQQSLMKTAITRDLPKGSPLVDAPVIPTDTMTLPSDEALPSVDDLMQQALTNRPEIEQSDIDLVNRDITKKAARNALLPTVDLFGFYGSSGLAGDAAILGGVRPSICTALSATTTNCVPAGIGTGYPNAFANLFNSTAPDKGAGINIIIPIRNRGAQADQVRSELEYRQAELRLQQLKNQIGIDVRNAVFALQQNKARVVAAQEGERLAQESLDAEQKKYALGASTTTLVLQAQRDLAQAESNTVAARSAYEESRVKLDQVTGNILKHNNIQLADAEVGVVNVMPVTPNVVPRTEPITDQSQPQPQAPPQPQLQQPQQPAPPPQ